MGRRPLLTFRTFLNLLYYTLTCLLEDDVLDSIRLALLAGPLTHLEEELHLILVGILDGSDLQFGLLNRCP